MGKKKNKGGGGGVTDRAEEPEVAQEEAANIPEGQPATEAPTPPPPAPPTPIAPPSSSSTTDVADGDATMTMRDTMVVTGTSETRHIPSVPYCEVCALPFEFCEWGPLFAKCKESFAENYKKHFPDVGNGEEELLQLMTRLGFEGGDEAAKKAQKGAKKAAAADGAPSGGGGGKKKEKAPPEIVIELNNRNKKKHITVVKGLDAFDVDTAAAAKTFGKKFACGSALKKAQDGQPESIEIQGNYRDELPALIVDKLKLSIENISIVVDGKKVKAAEAAGS